MHFFFASLGFDTLKILNSFFNFLSPDAIKTLAYHMTWVTVV